MDFTFEEEQRLAAQSLRELLDDHCTGADLRRAAEAREAQAFLAACAPRRAKLAELGLAGALVPADQGGLGLAAIDFVLLAEEAGRAALPEPLIDCEGIAHPLLATLARHDVAAAPVLDAVLQGTSSAPLVVCAWPGAPAVAWAPFADFFLTGKDFGALELHRAADVAIDPDDVPELDPEPEVDDAEEGTLAFDPDQGVASMPFVQALDESTLADLDGSRAWTALPDRKSTRLNSSHRT